MQYTSGANFKYLWLLLPFFCLTNQGIIRRKQYSDYITISDIKIGVVVCNGLGMSRDLCNFNVPTTFVLIERHSN